MDPFTECFFVALALAVVAALLASPVLAVLAFRRARRVERRVAELVGETERLHREVAALRREPVAGPAPADAPAPATERPAEASAAPPPRQVQAVDEAAFARAESMAPERAADGPPVRPAPPPPQVPAAAPPQPPPPPPAPPPAPPAPARPPFDWERWIGVRGAAVLAGILFALAGIYFVRFSIEQGWLSPAVRLSLGLLAGLGAVVGSEVLRRRGYEPTANGMAGGGVVVLYAALWAGRALYGLIPAALAFGLMVLVTAAAGAIAWRHRTQVVAVLGLAGGFATPLLLQTGTARPLGLFGYLLALDLALVFLARRRRWPLLAPLGLIATVGYEALWIGTGMAPGELALALAVLAVFAGLFALAGLPGRRPEGGEATAGATWTWTRFAAVTVPFAFALYLALRADLGPHLWPLATLMLILSVAAELLDRGRPATPSPPGHAGAPATAPGMPLGPVAAGAAVAVVAAWTLDRVLGGGPAGGSATAVAWELAGIAVALAAGFHAFAEIDLRRGRERPATGALVSAGGLLALVGLASLAADDAPAAAPWIAGWSVLAALLVRQGWLPAVRRRPVAAAALVGLLYPLFHLAHAGEGVRPEPALFFGLLVASAVALQAVALLGSRGAGARPWAEPAALALPVAGLAGLFGQAAATGLGPVAAPPTALPAALFLGLTLVLALLAILSATRSASGAAYLATLLLVAVDHLVWATGARGDLATELLPVALAVVLFTAWPFAAGPRFRDRPAAWWGAALAGPAFFLPLLGIWSERWGDGAIGLLPVLLGAVALAAAFRARGLWSAGDPGRLRALAWFGAVALGFAAVAVPLQLDREWITVGWALEGVAVVALWHRLDHPGLKYFGLALLGAVTARLVANPEVLGYHPRSGLPILNWLAYTYLVPAACLVGASSLLARHEVGRARPAERRLYAAGRPLGAIASAVAAVVVVFVWINLAVFDLFSSGPEVTLDVARTMARDLTLSLAWALYALVLLALGFVRGSRGLRGIGLGLLTLTVVKVFLYDLAGLEDLYRVASLAGLAVSLVLVSLAYQRFVFRKAPAPPEPGP